MAKQFAVQAGTYDEMKAAYLAKQDELIEAADLTPTALQTRKGATKRGLVQALGSQHRIAGWEEHMAAVVTGKLPEVAPLDCPELEISEDLKALPNAGGYLERLPAATPYIIKSKAAHPATKTLDDLLLERPAWVLVSYRGTPTAMTVEEAYRCGGREFATWPSVGRQ